MEKGRSSNWQAAEIILREEGKPLHYREITKRAIEKGLIVPDKKSTTPWATLRTAMMKAPLPIFEQLGNGEYGLKEWHVVDQQGSLPKNRVEVKVEANEASKRNGMLNDKQKEMCLVLFDDYQHESKREKVVGMTFDEWYNKRVEIGKSINTMITSFLTDKLTVGEFIEKINTINKQHNYWGFVGWKGRFFLTRLLSAYDKFRPDLQSLLKDAIREPKDDEDALIVLERFFKAVEAVANTYENRRKGPTPSSIPYFLTYFWAIQNPEKWDIQYTSTERAYDMLGFWSKTGNVVEDARTFLELTREIHTLFNIKSGKELQLRFVGHVIYNCYLKQQIQEPVEEKGKPEKSGKPSIPGLSKERGLPQSYIPPIMSILPQMARLDPDIVEICKTEGRDLPTEFEKRIADIFRLLGFDVERRGQGHGREPDVIVRCLDYHYSIIIDVKARSDTYRMGTDSRAFIEYINKIIPIRGMDKVYFGIVSSEFPDKKDPAIREIKTRTGIHGVTMFTAEDLLTILDYKLRNPDDFDLGPSGFLGLLADDGVVDISGIG